MTFNPDKVPGLSGNLLRSHHANNYAGTVTKLNATSEELAKLDFAKAPILAVSGLKREELGGERGPVEHRSTGPSSFRAHEPAHRGRPRQRRRCIR